MGKRDKRRNRKAKLEKHQQAQAAGVEKAKELPPVKDQNGRAIRATDIIGVPIAYGSKIYR
jgi:hypothetical protein